VVKQCVCLHKSCYSTLFQQHLFHTFSLKCKIIWDPTANCLVSPVEEKEDPHKNSLPMCSGLQCCWKAHRSINKTCKSQQMLGNTLYCYACIPSTSIKCPHSQIEVSLGNRENTKLKPQKPSTDLNQFFFSEHSINLWKRVLCTCMGI
jgi:hypothetical protein